MNEFEEINSIQDLFKAHNLQKYNLKALDQEFRHLREMKLLMDDMPDISLGIQKLMDFQVKNQQLQKLSQEKTDKLTTQIQEFSMKFESLTREVIELREKYEHNNKLLEKLQANHSEELKDLQ